MFLKKMQKQALSGRKNSFMQYASIVNLEHLQVLLQEILKGLQECQEKLSSKCLIGWKKTCMLKSWSGLQLLSTLQREEDL